MSDKHINILPTRSMFGCVSGNLSGFCSYPLWSGTHFTGYLWAYKSNFAENYIAVKSKLIIRPGHIFAHATTTELSGNVWYCDPIGSLHRKLRHNGFPQVLIYELLNGLWTGRQVSQQVHPQLRKYIARLTRYGPEDINSSSVSKYDLTLTIGAPRYFAGFWMTLSDHQQQQKLGENISGG